MRISDWSSDVCSSDLIASRTIQHVADAILHHVFQFTGQNPEMDRVALAASGAELVALGNGLSQRIERGDRKSVGSGKSVSVRVDLGGRRTSKKKTEINTCDIDKKTKQKINEDN